jgi:excisionase family DNA binding protein
MKDSFTTGDVARICRISQQTVIRCIDSGRLNGYRVPGSKFRRVSREALITFMKEHRIPLEQLDTGKRRVLVVDDDQAVVEMLTDIFNGDGRFEVRSAATGYDAGLLTVSFRPDVILLDYLLPDINGNVVCQRIRGNPELSETKIIIVSGAVRQTEIDALLAAGADEFIQKPFSVNHLLERLAVMLEL